MWETMLATPGIDPLALEEYGRVERVRCVVGERGTRLRTEIRSTDFDLARGVRCVVRVASLA